MLRVYEFLFRGAIPEEKRGNAWHAWLGDDVTAFGRTTTQPHPDGPMTPEKIKAQFGLGLPEILADINAQVLADLTATRQTLSDTQTALDAEKAARKSAENDIAQALEIVKSANVQYNALVADYNGLQTVHADVTSQLNATTQLAAAAIAQRDTALQSVVALTAAGNALAADHADLQAAHDEVTGQLADAQQQVAELSKSVDAPAKEG